MLSFQEGIRKSIDFFFQLQHLHRVLELIKLTTSTLMFSKYMEQGIDKKFALVKYSEIFKSTY